MRSKTPSQSTLIVSVWPTHAKKQDYNKKQMMHLLRSRDNLAGGKHKRDTDSYILVKQRMSTLSTKRGLRSLVTTLDLQANKNKK